MLIDKSLQNCAISLLCVCEFREDKRQTGRGRRERESAKVIWSVGNRIIGDLNFL